VENGAILPMGSTETATVWNLPMVSGAMRVRTMDLIEAGTGRDYSPIGINTTTARSVKTVYVWRVRNNTGASFTWYWGYRAGDDARGIGFIGPAPLILDNTASTGVTWRAADTYI